MRMPNEGWKRVTLWLLGVALTGGGSALAQVPPPATEPPVIAEIAFDGIRTIAKERILSHVKSKAGQPYDAEKVKADVARLMGTYLFYDVGADYEDGPKGRIVHFRLAERASIQEVVFEGNKAFSNDKLIETTGLRAGKAMDPGLNKTLAQEIERKYRDKGYPFVIVELVEGGRRDDARVVIRINEGPKTKVATIRFEGAHFVSRARLLTKLKSGMFWGVGKVGIFGGYEEAKMEEDVAALRAFYHAFGFLDVKISPKKDFTADKAWVTLTYIIEEGPRFKVGEVRINGMVKLPEKTLRKDIKLVSGQPFDEELYHKDAQKLKDAYGSKGYINAEVQPELRYHTDPGVVDVFYQVREDTPKLLGEVRIEGNVHTKSSIIRTIADLTPGEAVDTRKIQEATQNLTQSRLFQVDAQSTPTVELDPNNDPNSLYQNLLINLHEGSTGSLMFGVGVNSDSGVGGSVVINERNFDLFRVPTSWSDLWSGGAFRGAGQDLRLEAVPGTQVNRYSATLTEPRLFGTSYNLTSSAYYYERLYTNYHESRGGGRFTLGKRFNKNWEGSITMRAEEVNINNPSLPAPPELLDAVGNHFLYGPRVAVKHSTWDSALNPSQGHVAEVSYEQTLGDYIYPRFAANAKQFFTLWSRRDGSGKQVLSVRGEFGYTGDNTPIFERFYAGGFQTLRGFQYRGIGPVSFDQKVGGQFMLLSGVEYYMPLTADDNFGVVLFSDQGTVEQKIQLLNYRVTAGFGLRVRIPGMGPVPLAFDFAFPIAKVFTDDTQVFSFSIGIFR